MEQALVLRTVHEQTRKNKILFLTLYKSKLCNISATCQAIAVGRQTFYDWKEADPAFVNQVKEIEQSLIDDTECHLYKNIAAGKERSLIFFLTNRAPDRWVDKGNNISVSQTNVNVNKLDTAQMDDKELDSVVRNIVANR